MRMIQAIRRSGGFRKLDRHNLFKYVLRSGILYFGVVTVPQLIAVVLYFAPQGLYSPILNNFLLVLSSVMIARFLLGLREMSEVQRENLYMERMASVNSVSLDTVDSVVNDNLGPALHSRWTDTESSRRQPSRRGGRSSLLEDFDVEIEI
ncbi:hypothetical protein GYMLUDRAFT_248051 [Collybiopsis luxurians FD-317 M1]|uniref:Uncharacterized protein n=1 Tax=Collybiopsis luxurians FD-317 M1 TaxID=944289 RepID=A0A0D0BMY2_9AGAR|nr:hypothetical protein GYMLUDRAFT_248051 [Collybiopsis luxurians FD-317 M1]